MGESSLSLTYLDLMNEVSQYLYGKADYENLTDSENLVVDRSVQSGYRQFLYPPTLEGIPNGYEWTFLRPVATLDTTADDADQDLPDDFGRLIDGFTFPAGSQRTAVLADVGEGRIRANRAHDNQTGVPRMAAIRIKAQSGSVGQRREVMWWPIPDDAYTLSFKYESFAGVLSSADDGKYPLGAMKHGETLKASCLAAAELSSNDEQGIHWKRFINQLAGSIARDKREGQKLFGNVGCRGTYDSSESNVADYPYSLTVSGTIIQS